MYNQTAGGIKLALAVILLSISVSFLSCTKSDPVNDATKFAGAWSGASVHGSNTSQTFLIGVGSAPDWVTCAYSVGDLNAGCNKGITLRGEANVNDITFPTQSFSDNCGNNYEIGITGTLVDKVLTLTITTWIFVNDNNNNRQVVSRNVDTYACTQ